MIKNGIYKHSKKGNMYKVICTAKHSETLEDFVVYESLYDNEASKYWVRPASMFEELVEIEGNKIPRFVLIEEEK